MESNYSFELLDADTLHRIDQLIFDGSILSAIIEVRRAFNIESIKEATELHYARYTVLIQSQPTTFKEPNPQLYWKNFHS
jgi:hypothetical protein